MPVRDTMAHYAPHVNPLCPSLLNWIPEGRDRAQTIGVRERRTVRSGSSEELAELSVESPEAPGRAHHVLSVRRGYHM